MACVRTADKFLKFLSNVKFSVSTRAFYSATSMAGPASPLSPSQLNFDDESEGGSDDGAEFLNPKATEVYIRPSRRKGRGKTGRVNSPRRTMDWEAEASMLHQGEDEEGQAECDAALAKYMLSMTKHPWQPDFAKKGALMMSCIIRSSLP